MKRRVSDPRHRATRFHLKTQVRTLNGLDVVIEHGLAGDAVLCSPFAVCVVGLRVLSWHLELRHTNSSRD